MPTTIPSPANVPTSVGSGASQVIVPQNLSRQGLYVFNPSSVVIWVCPATTNTGAALAASVNGPGSVAIQPQQGLVFGFGQLPPFTNGLNGISVTGNNALTVWEFYP